MHKAADEVAGFHRELWILKLYLQETWNSYHGKALHNIKPVLIVWLDNMREREREDMVGCQVVVIVVGVHNFAELAK